MGNSTTETWRHWGHEYLVHSISIGRLKDVCAWSKDSLSSFITFPILFALIGTLDGQLCAWTLSSKQFFEERIANIGFKPLFLLHLGLDLDWRWNDPLTWFLLCYEGFALSLVACCQKKDVISTERGLGGVDECRDHVQHIGFPWYWA